MKRTREAEHQRAVPPRPQDISPFCELMIDDMIVAASRLLVVPHDYWALARVSTSLHALSTLSHLSNSLSTQNIAANAPGFAKPLHS